MMAQSTATPPAWPEAILSGRAAARPYGARLRTSDDEIIELDVRRWHEDADADDRAVLGRAVAPVLDVGCGPGRHVSALTWAGVAALGVDTSAAAVATTRRRGGPVIRASIFDPLPDTGRWATVLLLDGNIGIGGDEAVLLARVSELLQSTGHVLAEVEAPTTYAKHVSARVEMSGRAGRWFPWARVTADRLESLSGMLGYAVDDVWDSGGRWFVDLRRSPNSSAGRGTINGN